MDLRLAELAGTLPHLDFAGGFAGPKASILSVRDFRQIVQNNGLARQPYTPLLHDVHKYCSHLRAFPRLKI